MPDSLSVPSPTHKLQKVLADRGLGSRREMEEWIKAGRIQVNGAIATLGQRVGPKDRIAVDRRPLRARSQARLPRILLYHKPQGEIVTRDDPEGRASVFDRLPPIRNGKWLAIGRLDFMSSGLLMFTTDGELANRMMHPRYRTEREYAVRVRGQLAAEQMRSLTRGVELDDGPARFDSIEEAGGEGSNRWCRVVTREGRNRIVRRMFEAIGFEVSRLIRVRFGLIELPPRLKRGQFIECEARDVARLLEACGMEQRPAERDRGREPRRQKARVPRALPRRR